VCLKIPHGRIRPIIVTTQKWWSLLNLVIQDYTVLLVGIGSGKLPAVWVHTRKTGWFGSRPVWKLALLLVGCQYPDSYPSTHRFHQVWLDPLGPIPGSAFEVFLFMVAFSYPTVNHSILTMVHHSSLWMYWQPFWSKCAQPCSLPHPGNECQQSVNHFWSCILGNLSGNWLQIVITEVEASLNGKRGSAALYAPSWKWASTERQQFMVSHLG